MQPKIRASQLPKLAMCGQFESAPTTSEAAARGTRIDEIFRRIWDSGEMPNEYSLEEIKVAHWACGTLFNLGTNWATTCSEEKTRIFIPIINYWGTMDAVNYAAGWLADLKTGQIHNYKEQMAAYALGCMAKTSTDIWTAYLIFADQKEVVTHQFTFEEAKQIVKEAANNAGNDPTPNDYCQWCAKSLTCAPRLEAQKLAIEATETGSFTMTVLRNPAKLGEFLSRAKIFDDFREAAKDRARELLEAGERVPGWKLQKPRVSETLSVEAQLESGLPLTALLKAHGPITAKKAREIGGIDETKVIRKESRAILTQI